MSVIIKLTLEERRFCVALGKARHMAKDISFREIDRFHDYKTNFLPHFIGVLGELAYAKYTGLEIDTNIYDVRDGGNDFLDSIEIKTITYYGAGTPDLKIPEAEYIKRSDTKLYVLARTKKGVYEDVELLGQITREQFDIKKVAKKYGEGYPLNWIVAADDLNVIQLGHRG